MKKVRIQFETSEEKVKDMESLMEEGGVRTKRELFNNALTLLEWAAEEKRAERAIVSMSKNGKCKELVMPWMSHVRNNK